MKKTLRTIIAFILSLFLLLSATGTFSVALADPSEDAGKEVIIISEWQEQVTVYNEDGDILDGEEITTALPGSLIRLEYTEDTSSIYVFRKWILKVDDENYPLSNEEAENPVLELTMPDGILTVDLLETIDEEKESASIEESIRESEEEEKNYLHFGDYKLWMSVDSLTPPRHFVSANDTTNFSRVVGCFYSTTYRLYAYYGSKNEADGYCVLDPIGKNMFPFVLLTKGAMSYVVASPEDARDIPGVYCQETYVSISNAGTSKRELVPSFLVIDDYGNEITLLYLAGDDGKQDFYYYNPSRGVDSLLTYEEYEEEQKEPSSEDESRPTKAPDPSGNGISRTAIWIILIGMVLLIIILSLVIVYSISRHHERAEEAEEDSDGEEDEDEDEEEDDRSIVVDEEDRDMKIVPKKKRGAYASSRPVSDEPEDVQPFDVNFENSFPEELLDSAKPDSTEQTTGK